MKKARQWLLTVVTSAGLLAGCAVGPDYKRPTTTPPDVFRGSEVIQRNPLINTLLSLMRLVLWQELQHMPGVPRLTGFEMSQIYSFCTDLDAFTLAELRARCGDKRRSPRGPE